MPSYLSRFYSLAGLALLASTALPTLSHALPIGGALASQSEEQHSLAEKVAVFPHDKRKELLDTSAPWGAIGQLFAPDESTCTASLVGPNLLLTNAHCVADLKRGKGILAGTFTFKVQYRRGKSKASSRVTQIFTGGYKVSHDDRKGDWAVLVLEKRLGDRFGWFGISDYETSELLTISDRYKLYMAGYAYDWEEAEVPVWQGNCSFHQDYFSSGTILTHDCSTTVGASGSPMFIFTKDSKGKPQPIIVALHSGNQFAFDTDVTKRGKIVTFSDINANLAVHAAEFLKTVKKLRAQEN